MNIIKNEMIVNPETDIAERVENFMSEKPIVSEKEIIALFNSKNLFGC